MIEFTEYAVGGLEISDKIDNNSYILRTNSPITPVPCDTNDFLFAIDNAVTITAQELRVPSGFGISILKKDGEPINKLADAGTHDSVPRDDYIIRIAGLSNTYINVHDTGFDYHFPHFEDSDFSTIQFSSSTELNVGARSGHELPAETITTTKNPEDIMRAVSYLGSSHKEFSCERSWPTLRGHPPLIEIGEAFHAPPELQMPNSEITIEIPPTLDAIYAVTPLAYYLSAKVVPGETPLLHTENGFTYTLDSSNLGWSSYKTLRHIHTCDMLVRDGGYFDFNLIGLDRSGDASNTINYNQLYDLSIAEQIETYLQVPFEKIKPAVPKRGTAIVLSGDPTDAELLPYMARDFYCVRTHPAMNSDEDASTTNWVTKTLQKLSRKDTASEESVYPSLPEEFNSLLDHHTTTLNHSPLGVSRTIPTAFKNGHSDENTDDMDFSIALICNDESMVEELENAKSMYKSSSFKGRPDSLTIKTDTTVDELRAEFMSGHRFLHYIGHSTEDGFNCKDGVLDVGALPYVNIGGFLLNSCNSISIGESLIEKGAMAGVATRADILSSEAVPLGVQFAGMWSAGYPLYSAFDYTMQESPIITAGYQLLGDANTRFNRRDSNEMVLLYEIQTQGSSYDVQIHSFETEHGIAFVFDEDYLTSKGFVAGQTCYCTLSKDELMTTLHSTNSVVLFNGEYYWEQDITDEFLSDPPAIEA